MSEAPLQTWFNCAVSLLTLLMAYILNLYRGKVDALEKTSVTREELALMFEQEREDSERKHSENREDRKEDRQAMINLAQRIDRVLEKK